MFCPLRYPASKFSFKTTVYFIGLSFTYWLIEQSLYILIWVLWECFQFSFLTLFSLPLSQYSVLSTDNAINVLFNHYLLQSYGNISLYCLLDTILFSISFGVNFCVWLEFHFLIFYFYEDKNWSRTTYWNIYCHFLSLAILTVS